jgi:hypothetical protein
MQEENKKQNQNEENSLNSNPSKKIGYTIQTMDFDLKNKTPKSNFLDLQSKDEESKIKKESKEDKIVPQKKEKVTENFNPFLNEIRPTQNNSTEIPKPENKKPKPKELEKNTVIKKNIPIPPNKPIEKLPEKKSFWKNYLLIFLFSISIITLGSGVYYFYFKKASSETEKKVATQPPKKETTVIEKTETNSIAEKIKDTELVNLDNNDLSSIIEKNKNDLSAFESQYYKITQNSEALTISDFLSFLEIQLPEEISNNLNDYRLVFYNQNDLLKMGLVFEVDNSDTVKNSFLNNEYRLPEIFKPLFVDEVFALQDEVITFNDSVDLDGKVRFYNFVEGINDKSIDWGIIENKFLIITTSKDSAGDLINDLENLNQTSKEKTEPTSKNETGIEILSEDELSSMSE